MSKQRSPNGNGSYKKRSDGRCVWRQTVDGETRELTANTMKELQEKVKKIADLPIIKDKQKVFDWIEKWLEIYIKPLKKTATYNQYESVYRMHVKPVIGNRKLSGIKQYDIQHVIAEMNKKSMSTKTMKHAKTVMSCAFTKAFKEKLIAINPVLEIEIPIKQAKIRKTLTIQELIKVFNEMINSRWIWSIHFMLVTGLRRGELLALKWTDIDFENKQVTVSKSNSITGIGDTKPAKIHYAPLSDNAIKYLSKQKEMLVNEFNPSLHNNELKKEHLVFPAQKGTMVKPNTFYHMLVRFAKRGGVYATPHCFRHTFVYLFKDALSLKELQNALGHDESTTTLDIYGDILNASSVKTADKIDEIFNAIDLEVKEIEKKEGKILEFKRTGAKLGQIK